METPKLIALKNHFERQIEKLRGTKFPQAHDLACRLWDEAFRTEIFKGLFKRFEDLPLAKEAGQAMLGGTYFGESDSFTRAAFGYHFLQKFVEPYRNQYHQLLRNINEPVDDSEKYQIFLDRYCVLAFLEYLLFFLDEEIAGGGLRGITGKEEAFISYSTANKLVAGKIKGAFDELKIDSFMAHEDIQPSQEWQKTILEHLDSCTMFIPLITDDFMLSEWTQQEAGIAMGRGIPIIPICVSNRNPPGFLARYQALKIVENQIGAWKVGKALLEKKSALVLDYFIKDLKEVRSFRGAEEVMAVIVPYFGTLNTQQAVQFVENCIGNGQVWDAKLCRDEMIPEFIRLKGNAVSKDRLEVLEYQIKNMQAWPKGKEPSEKV